jgi:hypothetical protein
LGLGGAHSGEIKRIARHAKPHRPPPLPRGTHGKAQTVLGITVSESYIPRGTRSSPSMQASTSSSRIHRREAVHSISHPRSITRTIDRNHLRAQPPSKWNLCVVIVSSLRAAAAPRARRGSMFPAPRRVRRWRRASAAPPPRARARRCRAARATSPGARRPRATSRCAHRMPAPPTPRREGDAAGHLVLVAHQEARKQRLAPARARQNTPARMPSQQPLLLYSREQANTISASRCANADQPAQAIVGEGRAPAVSATFASRTCPSLTSAVPLT